MIPNYIDGGKTLLHRYGSIAASTSNGMPQVLIHILTSGYARFFDHTGRLSAQFLCRPWRGCTV